MTIMPRYLKSVFLILLLGSFLISPNVLALTGNETQADLEQQLKDIEQQIQEYDTQLSLTKTQKATLANKVQQLKNQQFALNLQIKATAIKLKNLDQQIDTVENNIKTSLSEEQKINKGIAVILRQINYEDENIIFSLLSANGLSDVFNKIQDYLGLTGALKKLEEQNKVIRAKLRTNQADLEDKKIDTDNLLQIKSIQEQGLKGSLGEQNKLLTETKGLESNYQTKLADSKKRAGEIRGRIYELFNTGTQINFGQAVEIAKWTASVTGVRAAFVLAVLTQESNLGKNVGTCNRVGDPPEKSWTVIMKPTRDQEPFKTITTELGLPIDTTPVSCPMRNKDGSQNGWGGAMGPAQFIPSTWMGYRAKVTKVTGKPANPWDIRDAFLASAIKLTADGADGTDDGDWKAAMKYFAGSVNLKYRFYGDNVLATTKKYLTDIAELQ